jgi:hypothetical protein
MNNTRRTVIKTTSAFGTLVALGLVTQQQAMAAVDRAGFDVKTWPMRSRPSVAPLPPATRCPSLLPISPKTVQWCPWVPPATCPTRPRFS